MAARPNPLRALRAAGAPRLSALRRAFSGRTAPPSRQMRCKSSASVSPVDSGGGGSGGGGSKGLGGDDGDDSASPEELQSILASAGKGLDSLPTDMADALKNGRLSKDVLQRFIGLQNSLLGPLLAFGGMRERLLADPNFIVKLAIEVGIGLFTKSSAEYAKRQDSFFNELDFVAANVVMALVADFCLVFLPAPTLSFAAKRGGTSRNAAQRWLASCPDNAFQVVPRGASPFSPAQRFGAVLRNGSKLLLVGFGSSVVGVGLTNALGALRLALDPSAVSPNPPQNLLTMSAAYGSYMAISSNLRYQVIAGVIEERGIEVLFRGSPRVQNALSFVVRTGNTFLGSLMWVDYIRLLGLQGGPKH